MTEETTILTKTKEAIDTSIPLQQEQPAVNTVTPVIATNVIPIADSNFFNVSVRAWLVILLTVTVCYMCITEKVVQEPLYGAFLLGIGFYLGQKKQ